MSQQCPFGKESIEKLKAFIDLITSRPELLHVPDLKFFRDYVVSLGATVPPPSSPFSEESFHASAPPKFEDEPITVEEAEESEPESELEFDTEGCIEPENVADIKILEMGDPEKLATEEEIDKAEEKRIEAMSNLSENNFERAIELFTEAIVLNPTLAVLFVRRGQANLKLNKANACIQDCCHALELNPDSATAYKFRGRAHRLLGNWEESAKDLRQACKIDFDEQTDEWLKEVTPNAHKIEQHRLKQERKRAEKEVHERTERVRKAKEAHARAAEDNVNVGDEAGGLGDFYKVMQDPEIAKALEDPEVAAAFNDMLKDPKNIIKYGSNPKIVDLLKRFSEKINKSDAGFPGMGGFGGFPGGFPGFPGAPNMPQDDGLD